MNTYPWVLMFIPTVHHWCLTSIPNHLPQGLNVYPWLSITKFRLSFTIHYGIRCLPMNINHWAMMFTLTIHQGTGCLPMTVHLVLMFTPRWTHQSIHRWIRCLCLTVHRWGLMSTPDHLSTVLDITPWPPFTRIRHLQLTTPHWTRISLADHLSLGPMYP